MTGRADDLFYTYIQMNIIKNKRPKNLNLLKIRMPVTAVVSILHRVSGIVLFLSIPYILWLLSNSLNSVEGFNYALSIVRSDFGKFISIVLLWAITHHFFAGVRFLLLDMDIAISRYVALKAAWLVQILVVITFVTLVFKVVV